MSTETMTPTTKLRYLFREEDLVLQQWWSNEQAVKMGPVNMIKGEWRDVPIETEDGS